MAYQAPPSMEFSRQEYWIGLPFPSPGDLPNPGTEPGSSALQADALPSEPPILGQKMYYSLVKGKNVSSLLSITDTVLLKNSHPTEK